MGLYFSFREHRMQLIRVSHWMCSCICCTSLTKKKHEIWKTALSFIYNHSHIIFNNIQKGFKCFKQSKQQEHEVLLILFYICGQPLHLTVVRLAGLRRAYSPSQIWVSPHVTRTLVGSAPTGGVVVTVNNIVHAHATRSETNKGLKKACCEVWLPEIGWYKNLSKQVQEFH